MIPRKDIERRLEKEGIYDLLRRSTNQWSKFNLAEAYRLRLLRSEGASFNDFLADNGVRPSAL